MKIIINNEPADKYSYMYEATRILGKDQKKIIQNPNMTIMSWNSQKIREKLAYFMIVVQLIILFTMKHDLVYDFLLVFCTLYTATMIWITVCFQRFRKSVDNAYKEKEERVITITKEEVANEKNDIKMSLSWDGIEFVLISHYSIAFIAKEGKPSIIIPIENKEEVLEAINKTKKDAKIIDNSSNYK